MAREGPVAEFFQTDSESLCAAGWEGDVVRLPGCAVHLGEEGMAGGVGRTRGQPGGPWRTGGGGTSADPASGGLGMARRPQARGLGSPPLLRLAPFLQRCMHSSSVWSGRCLAGLALREDCRQAPFPLERNLPLNT